MTETRKELLRTVKFVLFSLSAGIIQLGSMALMNELLHIRYWIAYLISLSLSVIWNFTLNRKFTFQSANNVPIAMAQVAGFYAVFTPVTTYLAALLTEPSYGLCWNEYAAQITIMVLNFVTEFLFQRFVVFRKSLDTAPIKKA